MADIYIGSGMIAIILLIFQMIVSAVAINIGSAATDRPNSWGATFTTIAAYNPANESGTITSVKLYTKITILNCEVATFYNVSGSNFSTRDTETIGTVTSGAVRTFGVNLTVEAGDYIGFYGTEGEIESYTGGGSNLWYLSGDQIPTTNTTFTFYDGPQISLYGTGTAGEAEEEENVIFFGINF